MAGGSEVASTSSPAKVSTLSRTQLEDALWRTVTSGKIKDLQTFFSEHGNHPHIKTALNSECEEYDEDGGHVLIQCVKEGRDKGPTYGGKDYSACLTCLAEKGIDLNKTDLGKRSALGWAVVLRSPNYVSKLLTLGADAKQLDQDGLSPFHLSIQKGYKEIVGCMIEQCAQVLNHRDGKGVPPLVIAVKYGHIDICRLLLEKGADINAAEEKTKRTSVYHAIRNKRIDILDILLKHKPRLDTIDSEGRSILYLVCESSDIRYFHKIIAECPHFSTKIMEHPADDDETPVIVACKQGNSEQLKHLLDEGAKVKVTDTAGKTPLHHCADNMETQCAGMVLDTDSSIIESKDEQGYTVFTLAVLVGNTNLMKLLIDRGADIHTQDNEGHRPSHWAAVCGHLKVLEVLIQHNADMSTPDHHHAYPIHYAAQMTGVTGGNSDPRIAEKILKKMLECKIKLDVVDDAGRQPLLWAACSGNAESCKLLLKASADINARDKDNLTALHCAASRGHHQCIEVLRKNGADVNLMDNNKCTPLFYAITLGSMSCTKALITAKTDVNHTDDRGRNAAHCAAIKGCLDTLKLLEKEKANLWHPNHKGDYPVHEAALKGHIDVVKYLIRQKNEKGAVNVCNSQGKTLLHIAAATNNLPLCKLLLNQDCNKSALMRHSGKEFTPYDIAIIKNFKDTAEYLKQKGAVSCTELSKEEKEAAKADIIKNSDAVKETVEDKNKKNQAKTKGSPAKEKPAKDDKSPEKKDPKSEIITPPDAKKEDNKKTKDTKDSDKKAQVESDNKTKETNDKKQDNKSKSNKNAEDKSSGKNASPAKVKEKEADNKESATTKQDKTAKTADTTDKTADTKTTKEEASKDNSKDKKDKAVLVKTPSADSLLEKADGVTSPVSEDSVNNEANKPAKTGDKKKVTASTGAAQKSKMGNGQAKAKQAKAPAKGQAEKGPAKGQPGKVTKDGKKDEHDGLAPGEKLNVDDIETTEETGPRTSTGRKSKVGFNKTDNEDSGNETDPGRSKSRSTVKSTKKPYVDSVKRSVHAYQTTRNTSRSMQQLKRAQIHTGPMHDIVLFSKMMDNYRRSGVNEAGEELDFRNYANWEGYLNDQLRFVSHLYNDESSSTNELQDIAKEHHKMLETEANSRKQDSEMRCEHIEKKQEFQRKKNQDMDKEIDNLAARTAEMFDSVKTGASSSTANAKSRNQRMKDEIKKNREERLQNTTDPKERAILERQQMEEEMEERQAEIEQERKERHRNWTKRKEEDMRKRLLSAYRPYFPNDVFNKKSVCVSGGRVKSAGRMRVTSEVSTSSGHSRRSQPSPRPMSHKSESSSAAQFRLKEEKNQVQMTPYGLRRVRNQDRPSYANWSRKYDGSIRPRTGLVFVEPNVYHDIMQDEKDTKQRLSSEVQHHLANGQVSFNETDSQLS